MPTADADIVEDIRTLLAARDADASVCPSEVARRLGSYSAWRDAMPQVRRVARALARRGCIVITQADSICDPDAPVSGPVRLRRGPRWQASRTAG